MRFCPKCGKKGIEGEFCSECAEEELGIEFKEISIKKCIHCSRFMIQHQWREFKNPDEGIITAAHTRIKNPRKVLLDINPVHDALKDKPGATQDIRLEISAGGQGFVIPARIEFTYCNHCSKIGTEYFEGVLQLRDVTQELLDFVKKDIAENKGRGVHVVKESGKLPDIDIKLTSAKHIRALAKRLKQKFNGELKETSRLFSRDRQTGKDIHRISVLFTQRGHRVGDIVEQRGRKIKVKTLGKKVSGVDIETGKKVFLD
jgi:NMD protein affecting ribosome stability and mRNA decay